MVVQFELQQGRLCGLHLLGKLLRVHQLGVLRDKGPPDTTWCSCRLAAAGVSCNAPGLLAGPLSLQAAGLTSSVVGIGWEGCGTAFRSTRQLLQSHTRQVDQQLTDI